MEDGTPDLRSIICLSQEVDRQSTPDTTSRKHQSSTQNAPLCSSQDSVPDASQNHGLLNASTAESATEGTSLFKLVSEMQTLAPKGMRYVVTLEPNEHKTSFESVIKSRGCPCCSGGQPTKRRKMSTQSKILTETEYSTQIEEKQKRCTRETARKPPIVPQSNSVSSDTDDHVINKSLRQRLNEKGITIDSSENESYSESDSSESDTLSSDEKSAQVTQESVGHFFCRIMGKILLLGETAECQRGWKFAFL